MCKRDDVVLALSNDAADLLSKVDYARFSGGFDEDDEEIFLDVKRLLKVITRMLDGLCNEPLGQPFGKGGVC